jgi:predicted transcriptional regulator
MPETKDPYLERPLVPTDEEVDAATLEAIEEGRRDAEAGRVVPAAEVRTLVKQWTTPSSTRKER